MDPLSMTASIVAILQLTSKLTKYIRGVKHATAEQAKVAIEASNLCSLLTNLRYRVEAVRSDDPWVNQVRMLGIHDGPLDQLKDVLEGMVQQISYSRKRDHIKSTLMWQFTKSEVENALERMERLKSSINCALTGDLLTQSQATFDNVVALSQQTETLRTGTERLQSHADQELQNKLSRWLGLPDPSTNFHTALEKRQPETGLWFINGQQFDRWKSSASSLMWLHGNTGCGKTVLSAASLQKITQVKETQPDTVVSYFYFDFNEIEKKSSKKAIRSLLFQFTLQQRGRLPILEQLYQKCGNGQQQPAEDVIRSLLKDAIVGIEHKYIILDALDECADREKFVNFIRELIESPQDSLHVMITSRREKDIEEQLGSIANYDINIQSAVVDEDIRVYVRDRLATDSKLRKWPEKVQEEIITAIMEKADGMFRWVYCQLESIRQCVKLSTLRKALSTLPKTLDETYDRILEGIKSAGQLQDAIKALRWLCFSDVPLYLSEIVEVLAIENGESGGFCPDERLPDPGDIMVICSSLISCSEHNDEKFHRIGIRLAHFSVKEYLLSDRCLLALDFQMPTCQMAMAEGCLHYLLYLYENLPLTEDLIDRHPLSRYAAEYWWQHARATDDTLSPTMINITQKILMNKGAGVLPWIQLYDADRPGERIDLSLTMEKVAPPLYYATSTGLSQVVEKIIPQIVDINAQGGFHGNALQAASAGGHEKVMQILLDAGADINAQGGYYGNALQAASACGYKKVVQILLDAGANIKAQGGMYNSALQAASAYGHEKIVQILLDAGADIKAQGGAYSNALQAASVGGHKKVVQILLDTGADVNAQGGHYSNALQAASAHGHGKVVQILLNTGADINAQGGAYSNALQAASIYGHKKVVQILLDTGADINAQGGDYGNALQAALVYGDEKVVQILLDAGADINAQGGHYSNALQAASAYGQKKVVQILLDAGADVNAQGGFYNNALQAASAGGHEKVVQILLNTGADIKAQGGLYNNALQAASACGREKVVQILLDAGADIKAQGLNSNALLKASAYGYKKVVQILLNAGADVNAQGGLFSNALQAASIYGHENVVQILLDAEADIKAQGEGPYGNALQEASARGHEKVVQMLLDAGADINAQGLNGSALQIASARGHEKLVQILLDTGADTNAQGGHGSALQLASARGHEKVVQILLDAGADVNVEEGNHDRKLGPALSVDTAMEHVEE